MLATSEGTLPENHDRVSGVIAPLSNGNKRVSVFLTTPERRMHRAWHNSSLLVGASKGKFSFSFLTPHVLVETLETLVRLLGRAGLRVCEMIYFLLCWQADRKSRRRRDTWKWLRFCFHRRVCNSSTLARVYPQFSGKKNWDHDMTECLLIIYTMDERNRGTSRLFLIRVLGSGRFD